MARLTPEQRVELLVDYQENLLTTLQIAEKYGVSQGTVNTTAKKAGLPQKLRPTDSPEILHESHGAWVYGKDMVGRWVPGAKPSEDVAS